MLWLRSKDLKMPCRSLGGKQNVSCLRFRTSGPGKARGRAARRSAGRGSGLRACRASSAMPLLRKLLNGLPPTLHRSRALASALSRSCQGRPGALAWGTRTGPGARAGEGGLGRERACREPRAEQVTVSLGLGRSAGASPLEPCGGEPAAVRASSRPCSSPLRKAAPPSCAVGSSRREIFGGPAHTLISFLLFPACRHALLGRRCGRVGLQEGSSGG